MKHLLQIQPPFTRFVADSFLAGSGFGPPFLCAFIFGHDTHIFLEIRSNIFEIGKEGILIMDENGVIPDVAFMDHVEYTGPGIFVQFEVIIQFFRSDFYDLCEAARHRVNV